MGEIWKRWILYQRSPQFRAKVRRKCERCVEPPVPGGSLCRRHLRERTGAKKIEALVEAAKAGVISPLDVPLKHRPPYWEIKRAET